MTWFLANNECMYISDNRVAVDLILFHVVFSKRESSQPYLRIILVVILIKISFLVERTKIDQGFMLTWESTN